MDPKEEVLKYPDTSMYPVPTQEDFYTVHADTTELRQEM